MMNRDTDALLVVKGLHIAFDTATGPVYAVNGVDLHVAHGEVLAILGESGCGKTATAKAVTGILECPPGRIRRGSILYEGRELTVLGRRQRRSLMGTEIGWIPQDPLSALDPSFRIGYQVVEVLRAHTALDRKAAAAKTVEMLAAVSLPKPDRLMRAYPHQLSGGMRQRVLIAMALALSPQLLIADEPTTALDVTVQAENILLLKDVQAERHMGVVLITHDCALAAAVADRVAIMYAGQIVENGPTGDVFRRPAHPYTRSLLQSTPSLAVGSSLVPIPGTPPKLRSEPDHCSFMARCSFAIERCGQEVPPAEQSGDGRAAACFEHEAVLAQPPVRRDATAGAN